MQRSLATEGKGWFGFVRVWVCVCVVAVYLFLSAAAAFFGSGR